MHKSLLHVSALHECHPQGVSLRIGTYGVSKHLGGDVVHVFCVYSSACKLGFIN